MYCPTLPLVQGHKVKAWLKGEMVAEEKVAQPLETQHGPLDTGLVETLPTPERELLWADKFVTLRVQLPEMVSW